MENNDNVSIGFDPPKNRKPWQNVIIRRGIELDWEYNLLMLDDIVKCYDRKYVVTAKGWRRA